MNNIVIINYGLGNLRSVKKAFSRAGARVIVSSSKADIQSADKLVLPGVGHFAEGMKKLRELDLVETLNEVTLVNKKPILGICLGMQLMTSRSDEGDCDGLNWIDAHTKKFEIGLKVPHIGWNTMNLNTNSPIMNGLKSSDEFYFTHSYYVDKESCRNKSNILTNYEIDFISSFNKDNIFGVQFHPEKSHKSGIQLIKNFIDL